MLVTPQTVITVAAVIAAIVAILKYYNKAYDLVKKQGDQDKQIADIKEEQQLLTYGVLACLKGLHEQGCNDSVTDAIGKIEKHLNAKAHT
jgi:hypothetical protein